MRQNRLAKMLGIDEAYLSRIINGYREPNGAIRESLAEILRSDQEWLFHKVQINDELTFGIGRHRRRCLRTARAS